MAPVSVGSAYVTIRAITTQLGRDITKGIESDVDTDAIGQSLGSRMAKSFGDSFEKDSKGTVSKAISSAGDDTDTDRVGKTISRGFWRSFGNALSKDEAGKKEVGRNIVRSLVDLGDKIKMPGGWKGWAVLLGGPALGAAVQAAVAFGGGLVAILGQIATAAAGAGVAMLGLIATIGPAAGVLAAAFLVPTEELENFKESASELLGPFEEIARAAQVEMFPGMLTALGNLQAFIPMLSTFAGNIGAIAGDFAVLASEILTSGENMDAFQNILSAAEPIFETLLLAVSYLLDALPELFEAAAPIAAQFVDSLAGMAERFRDFIEAASESGVLAENFQLWYDRAARIMGILGDIFIGLWNILQIGGDASDEMFAGFETAAQRFRDWTEGEGVAAIQRFFDGAMPVLDAFGRLARDVFAIFGEDAFTGSTEGIVGFIDALRLDFLPLIQEIKEGMQESGLGDALERVALAFLSLIGALAGSGGTAAFFDVLATAMETLATAMENPIFGEVLGVLLPLLGVIKGFSLIVGPLMAAAASVQAFASGLVAFGAFLISPPGLALLGLAAIATGIYLAFTHWDEISKFVEDATEAIEEFVSSIGDVFSGDFDIADFFLDAFEKLPDLIGRGLVGALEVIPDLILDVLEEAPTMLSGLFSDALDLVIKLFREFGPKIASGLGVALGQIIRFFALLPFRIAAEIPGFITTVGPPLMAAVVEVFQRLPGVAAEFAVALVENVITYLRALPQLALVAIQSLGSFLVGFLNGLIPGAGEAASGLIASIVDWFSRLPQMAVDALASFGRLVANVFTQAWPTFQSALSGLIENVLNFFRNLPGQAATAMGNFASSVAGVISSSWNILRGAVDGVINNILNFFRNLPANAASAMSSFGSTISSAITGTVGAVTGAVSGLIESIMSFFRNLPGKISSALAGIGGSITSAVRSAVKSAWNSVIGGIPGVHISFDPPGPGSFNFDWDPSDHLYWNAMGSIVNNPILSIVGEAGPEVIIPLSRPARALQLMRDSGLDRLAMAHAGTGAAPIASLVSINQATFVEPTDVDALIGQIRLAYSVMGGSS